MKKIYFNFKTIAIIITTILSCNLITGQTKEDVLKITSEYDLKKGQELYKQVKKREQLEKTKAIEFAKANNLPVFKENEDGSFDEIMFISPDGLPIYYSIHNAQAATSTRVDFLRSGGGLGLNLTGAGMVPRMWDGGPIHNHQEYAGRITMVDGTTRNTNSFHSIHVMGTMIASGTFGGRADAKGMAPNATGRSFDWNDDESEAISEAMGGMLLSNHSYGVPVASVSSTPWYIGAYSQEAYNWDVIAFNFPYYLPVMSAGNDGTSTNPSPSTSGFDKLNGNKNAKNILTVANAQDATVNASGLITSGGLVHSSSSQGPSDDRRIKPDITGDGAGTGSGIYSCGNGSGTGGTTNQYATMLGTSMAGPNVTGTLTLVQEHYKNVNGKFMKAATLKGLACHTATDRGRTGPDANYGWGFLDAKSCVEAITNNGLTSWISEETLSQGQTFTMQVVAQGGVPLLGSATWTDALDATKINSGVLNESTPDLTNDLDIRITQGASTFYPWRLQNNAASNATRSGDNNVDNVERINIDSPTAGATYTITITHKGTLVNALQKFSLIVTGVTSNFTFKTTVDTKTVCSSAGSVAYNFNLTKIGGANVNLTAANIPAGANVVINPISLSATSTFTATVNNLSAVTAGTYEIDIIGNNGTETETRKITLIVYHDDFTSYPQTTSAPTDGLNGVSTSPTFTWNTNINAENYNLQIATDPAFSSIISNTIETLTTKTISGLSPETVYYWRVIPTNRCATGIASATKSFQTGTVNCGFSYTQGTNVAISNAADNSGALALGVGWSTSTLNVPGNFTIGDVNMDLLLQHTYIQDLTIYLEAPDLSYTIIAQEVCGDNDNIDAKFIDTGVAPSCTAAVPALTGNVQPLEAFTNFQNLNSNGTWTLYVNDPYAGDDGIIDSWTLNLCSISAISNVPTIAKSPINTLANSTYEILTSNVEATTPSQTSSEQIYTLVATPSIGSLKLNTTVLIVGNTFTQNDIDTGKLSYINAESVASTTSFKVNVKNTNNGWLPNQEIFINIIACGDISTTWNGSTWLNGVIPSKITAVTFTGTYNSVANLEACSVTIATGVNVTINAGHTLIVNGDVTVNGTGTLTINNNAALRQIDDSAVNTGNIIIKRDATAMNRLDYTAWSSPVSGQQLQAFSPNTIATRFYQYSFTGTTTPTAYQSVTATTNFLAAKGYMIRADNTYTSATVFNGQFTGVPFNGIKNQNIGQGFNLLGNPYPSPISANSFLAANSSVGTLYFWTNTTAASGGVYPQNNFAAYTSGTGGVAAFSSGKTPNATIQTGQGFYLRKTTVGTVNAVFNNSQRVDASVSTQFYRSSETTSTETEKHRVWLNLNDNTNAYNQILIGYIEGATNAADNQFDGLSLDSSSSSIYSTINDDKYVIQGKPLPFTDEDIVPLGLNAVTAGVYNISLETLDGLFTTQDVFLKDNYTNIIHDIKQSAYVFTTQDGTFIDRFEVVYRNGALSNEDFTNENTVLVASQNNQLTITSLKETIKEVMVFDILGRNLYHNTNVNEKVIAISALQATSQALFVKITLTTGETITKKMIF